MNLTTSAVMRHFQFHIRLKHDNLSFFVSHYFDLDALLSGPSNRTRIEGWDVTFAMDWQIIPQTTNQQSAGRLIVGH